MKTRNLKILILLMSMQWIGIVEAENKRYQKSTINGSYGMTSSQSCVRTPFAPPSENGFDEATGTLLVEGESISSINSGVMKFNRDGSVIITEGKLTEILNDLTFPGDVPVSPLTSFSCEGEYHLHTGRKMA